MSFIKEDLTEESILLRHCHYTKRERISKKERRHPNESNFILREGETYLSFNWDKYASPERSYLVMGLTYSSTGNFIPCQDYTFFKYPYSILRSTEGVIDIAHEPDFIDNPSPVGAPNNKSHSGVFIEPDNLQIRMNLADYPRVNYDSSKCSVDLNSINQQLVSLRARLNDTEYHKLWRFDTDV